MVVVKKYGNRRLYDTSESCYITLDELATRIRGGDQVQVVDAKTGRDLTQQTLAHIILESRGASKLLPVPLLEQLIRMGDQPLAEFFGMYLSGALEMYLAAKRGAAAMMPFNPFAQMGFGQNPFASMMGGWRAPQPPAPIEPPPDPDEPDSSESEALDQVADLRRELEELKRAIKGED